MASHRGQQRKASDWREWAAKDEPSRGKTATGSALDVGSGGRSFPIENASAKLTDWQAAGVFADARTSVFQK